MDIADRHRVEEALRERESELNTIFAQAPVGLSELSLDGRFLRANKRLCEMLGRGLDELLTLHAADVTHPEDLAASAAAIRELIATGAPASVEQRYLRGDGNVVFVMNGLARLDDAAGRPRAILAVSADMTERRRTELALHESEERLRLLVESATDFAILTLSPDRVVTSWSPGAVFVFGYAEDEIVGRSGDVLFTPEDRELGIPEAEAITAINDGRAADERWHLRKDGSRFYASGVMTPLRDGGFRGFVKVARDLTDRKRMEDALRHSRDVLEARVAERTAELVQSNEARLDLLRQLSNAQEQERLRLSRELHDQIGQLLTGLILHLRATEDGLKRGMAAHEAAHRLVGLRTLVEEIGKEVHEVALRLRPTALDDLGLVAALRNYVEHWSARANIKADFFAGFESRLPPEVETALYRVVQESLNNVLKHSNATRVSILLEKRDGTVVAIVEDNGAGFIVSADEAKTRGQLGILGMRERLLAIGGELEIESSPGSGTTLFARAPLSETAE